MKARRWVTTLCAGFLIALLNTLPVHSGHFDSTSDPVRAWNELAIKTARTKSLNDARSARLFAMVNAAMYDAINGIVSRHGPQGRGCAIVGKGCAFVPPRAAPSQGDLEVAASAAAHAVLAGEFPDLATGFPDGSAGYDAQLESRHGCSAVWQAATRPGMTGAGTWAGGCASARTGDSPTVTQARAPADRREVPGRNGQASTSGRSPSRIRAAYRRIRTGGAGQRRVRGAYAQVKLLGNKAIPSPEMQATYDFWSLGGGTSQPPGAWLRIALIDDGGHSAAVDGDGAVVCAAEHGQRRHRGRHDIDEGDLQTLAADRGDSSDSAPRRMTATSGPRPIQPGRNAALPRRRLNTTPGTARSAAPAPQRLQVSFAVTISRLKCSPNQARTPDSKARHYDSFSAAGNEMGDSRIAGGLHFQFSNKQGLAQGRAVAAEVLATRLLLKNGRTHFGSCPR